MTVHLAAFGGKRSVWIGKSPSIRRAEENSSLLKKYLRRFYMQRIENPTGKVSFIGVMEPHRNGKSKIRKVTVPCRGLVKVELADRTDYIFCDLDKPVKLDGKSFAARSDGFR